MGLFDGLADARASMDSNWIKPGHYLLLIQLLKSGTSRKNEEFLCLEGRIIHVFNNANDLGHRLGEDVSHMLMKKHDSFLGNVKAMVKGCLGCEVAEVTEEMAEVLLGDDQPLAGGVVEIKARIIQTRAGKDFTKITYSRPWASVDLEQTLSDLAKTRYFNKGEDLVTMKQREDMIDAELAAASA